MTRLLSLPMNAKLVVKMFHEFLRRLTKLIRLASFIWLKKLVAFLSQRVLFLCVFCTVSMRLTSQGKTMDDIVEETKSPFQRIGYLAEDEGMFKNATAKLDPSIYKGEFRPYKSESKAEESGVKLLEEMAKNTGSLDDWFAEQYEHVPPVNSFEQVALQYLQGDAQELYGFLKNDGREFYDITRVGSSELGDAVAAVAVYGNEAALLGNEGFYDKVKELAGHYGVSEEIATRYMLDHEFVHTSQKNRGYGTLEAELDVEQTLSKFYNQMVGQYAGTAVEAQYVELSRLADTRSGEVVKNYSGLSGKVSSYSGVDSYSSAA